MGRRWSRFREWSEWVNANDDRVSWRLAFAFLLILVAAALAVLWLGYSPTAV
jgi:hypothetical protein